MDSYAVESYLGSCCGNFGKVFVASRKDSSILVAIRQYSLEKTSDETPYLKEVLSMKQLKHLNLISCVESFIYKQTLNIVTPLADFGCVAHIINQTFQIGIPEQACSAVLRDVLQAVNYLHSKGYIHRNIRASHIFLSSQGKALLGGLRDALCILERGRWQKTVHDFPVQLAQSLSWLSPELLEQNLRGYSQMSDIYSIGITACEMANGVAPYADLPSTQMLIEKLRGPPPQLWDSSTLTLPLEGELPGAETTDEDGIRDDNIIVNRHIKAASRRTFSRFFHQFTLLCLQREPSLRPSASQLLKHAFFQHIKKGAYHNWSELLSPARPVTADSSESRSTLPDNVEQFYLGDQFKWDFTVESDL